MHSIGFAPFGVLAMITSLFLAYLLAAGTVATPTTTAAETKKTQETFKPFTGKVTANKVRIRVKPDLESHILRQIDKNELLLVVSDAGDFYGIEPTKNTKAYVFRSYILDGVVEANRVNVRLEPHPDAPIIGQLQVGDRVEGQVCSMNHKWLQIDAPKGTRFFVSKEFIEPVGGPEYLLTMQKRKTQVEDLLNSAYLMSEAECKKSYPEMNAQQALEAFQHILRNFADFPEACTQAKEGLALLKETILNKKIEHLEAKAELSNDAKNELIAKHKAEKQELFSDAPVQLNPNLWQKRTQKKTEMTEPMRMWDTIEESLYLSWSAFHIGKKIDDFYAEQKANASVLSGTIEPYEHMVKDRPGDFILRVGDVPVAYLYSTHIDLEKYIGKEVTVQATPRPNHHFAFPAYFVLSVE
ncbi:MAG: hypothetical protein HY069_01645 [Chlamydiia bacterium]|nr:hypothetical protein [Chlamydiia bacterium]